MRPLIQKTARMLTDCMDAKFGLVKMDENRMEYNLLEHQYEISVLLKQGSYNYQYLFVRNGEAVGRTAPTEGDFHQTENEYCVYVYHRPFGGRYDKLVGFKSMNFKE